MIQPDGEDAARPTDEDAARPTDDKDATRPTDGEDPADTIDADILELLAQDFNCDATLNPGQGHSASSDRSQSLKSQQPDPVPPLPPLIPSECSNTDDLSPLIVDSFPHGSPGAPIPGARQGSHPYQSSQEAFGNSIWAPFRSQCDWEIVRWAKMRGPTSSAVADLLAIPEVCALLLLFIALLTQIGRSLTDFNCHITRQKN